MKGGRLPSLMRHILNRTGLLFVILLSPVIVAGCSSDPRLEANRAIERANEEISAHDELFDEARGIYSETQQAVRESGENPESTRRESTGTTGQAEDISEARDTLEEARDRLQAAQEEISGIQDLEVSQELLRYSRTLDGALADQIRGEEREISFYEILAEDPALEENRDRAIGILAEAEDAYAAAESGYAEAKEIADSNPDLIVPESGSTGN